METLSPHIAVSGINAGDSPAAGVGVIRSIRKSPEFSGTITGFGYDPLDPGLFMRGICDHGYLLPLPSAGSESLLARIAAIHEKNPLDVIIPTLDSELSAYLVMEPRLREMGIATLLPTREGLDLRSKARFDQLSQKGIRVPRGRVLTDAAGVYSLEKDFAFPIMVKGQFYEAFIAQSPADAAHFFHKLSAKWGLPVIVQEYIPGQEYDVVALGDGQGGMTGAVPMKKMQLTDMGKAWGGITVADPAMAEFAARVMEVLKWRGPCELEIMRSTATGEHYLLEINPRFPAWCYLAAGAGQNLPWATVKLALGLDVPAMEEYQVGAMFLRNSVDHIYSLDEYQTMTTAGEIHPGDRKDSF